MTTSDTLDERYGRVRTPRQTWTRAIVIAIAAVIIGGFAWITVSSTLDDVQAEGTAYTIDDSGVTVSFQISIPAGRSVACALEAQDEEHGVVGFRVVEIPAADQHTRAFRETIPTVAPATTGLVNSCWVT